MADSTLPPRHARSLAVHAAVDAAIAFLALVMVLWILSIPIWVTVIAAAVVGVVGAPLTRRAEQRALDRRRA
jgi:hypothetical protein